ncbi:unnamed protein product [Mytilus coruscus]|uniref:Uncharacterized protein n=1 Tax=Mytilus coruscus TaxID=42192 RepID=A0A6J8D7W9_MYTCO|nr:unnamed protein product [Mytilus coruscus]
MINMNGIWKIVFLVHTVGQTQHNYVRLDWEYHQGYLEIKCFVRLLKRPLVLNFKKDEKASCTSVYPEPSCISYVENSRIEQSVTTNITTLNIRITDPDLFNGQWVCIHGQHNSSTMVDIDVNRIFSGTECVNIAYQSEMTAFFVLMFGTVAFSGYVDIFKGKIGNVLMLKKITRFLPNYFKHFINKFSRCYSYVILS